MTSTHNPKTAEDIAVEFMKKRGFKNIRDEIVVSFAEYDIEAWAKCLRDFAAGELEKCADDLQNTPHDAKLHFHDVVRSMTFIRRYAKELREGKGGY